MDNKKEDDLIKDVLNGTNNSEEVSEIVRWFATDEGQEYLSDDIDETMQSLLEGDGEEFVSSDKIPSDEMLARINQQIRFRETRRIWRRWVVAAIMIPFALLAGFFLYTNSSKWFEVEDYAEIYVPKGEQKKITLKDGTLIYLGSDTHLRYPKNFVSKERRVALEGEGYFVVKKDPKCPFFVEMGDADIRVLGTSFNVDAYPENDQITLQLDEGSIKLTSSLKKEYLMVPGEKLTYSRQNGDCSIAQTKSNPLLKNWENNTFSFENASLKQILETLNHWFNVDFQIENAAVLDYSYTFEPKRNSLEGILSDMEKVSPIQFKSEGKVIKVSIK